MGGGQVLAGKVSEGERARLAHIDLDGENRSCREYRSAKNKADITTTSKRDFEPVENSYNAHPPCLLLNLNRSTPETQLLLRRMIKISRALPRILLQELRDLRKVFRRQLYIPTRQIFQSALCAPVLCKRQRIEP